MFATQVFQGLLLSKPTYSSQGETVNPTIILTGVEQHRATVQTFDTIADAWAGRGTVRPAGPATYSLVFNDGALRVPCDQDTFSKIKEFWHASQTNQSYASEDHEPESIPEGASTFSADDESPVDQDVDGDEDGEDWAGEMDESEDGVGQL